MAETSLVTLHYCIALQDGDELLSTFGGAPATLALGAGELAPGLERCVAEAEPGRRHVFQLEPGQAFGVHRPELVQELPRTAFGAEISLDEGTIIEFSAPDGSKHAGIVRSARTNGVGIDFNHPLAGCAIRFELEIIDRTACLAPHP